MIRQAGCVAIQGRGILIEGPAGSGKSSLALALIDRGAQLVSDDGVVLSVHDGSLWAAPHANTLGMLEVRNLGILHFAVLAGVRICLKVTLDPAAPRHIDRTNSETIAGVDIAALSLWPGSPILALRVELALHHYGLA